MHAPAREKLAISLISLGLCMGGMQPALANVMEELQVQPDKTDHVVRIKFHSRIHFIRQVAAEKGSAAIVFFRIVEG